MPDPILVDSHMVETTFEEAAPLYDTNGVFAEYGQKLVDLLDLRPGASILDVAVGAGAVLLPAARQVGSRGHVTGIDISENMVRRTRQTALSQGLSNVSLMKMDGGTLRCPDSSFDAVTCGFGIFFLPGTALAEIYRVCKVRGKIGLTVFDKTVAQDGSPGDVFGRLTKEYGIEFKYSMPLPARFTPDELKSLIASHGFEQIVTSQSTEDTVYRDLDAYWQSILSAGNRSVLTIMDSSTRDRFKTELFERLASLLKPDGLHHLFAAICVTGVKSGAKRETP